MGTMPKGEERPQRSRRVLLYRAPEVRLARRCEAHRERSHLRELLRRECQRHVQVPGLPSNRPDLRERLVGLLEARGHRVKLAGG